MKNHFLVFIIAGMLLSCKSTNEELPPAGEIWQPAPMTTFQWQLDGTVNTGVDAAVYDIDAFEATRELVSELHSRNIRVIGYISVGSCEIWRPDASLFPDHLLGAPLEGWPDERWVDIRHYSELAPVLLARLDMIRDKGFDAVEPDNIDAYENTTGFAITKEEELVFVKWLADEAHKRGLSIGQKNAPDLAEELWPICDWALTEDCYEWGWCELMTPYIQHKKAVFAVEYTDAGIDFDSFCAWCTDHQYTGLLKNRDLDDWRQTCP